MSVVDLQQYRMNRERVGKSKNPRLEVNPKPRNPAVPESIWGMPKRVCDAATALGIGTQKELQERTGVPQSIISRVMNYRNLVGLRADTLAKLSVGLGVPVDWLLLGYRESVPRSGFTEQLREDVLADRPKKPRKDAEA